jgi:hypothetical protein
VRFVLSSSDAYCVVRRHLVDTVSTQAGGGSLPVDFGTPRPTADASAPGPHDTAILHGAF